jgi:hypothetical protein
MHWRAEYRGMYTHALKLHLMMIYTRGTIMKCTKTMHASVIMTMFKLLKTQKNMSKSGMKEPLSKYSSKHICIPNKIKNAMKMFSNVL